MRESENVSPSPATPTPPANAAVPPLQYTPATFNFDGPVGIANALARMDVDRRAAVVHEMQKAVGNRAVSRFLSSEPLPGGVVLGRQQRGAGLPVRRSQRPDTARLAALIDHADVPVLQAIEHKLEEAAHATSLSVMLEVDGFQGTISPRDVAGLTERLRRRLRGDATQSSLPPLNGHQSVPESSPSATPSSVD